MKKLVCFLSVAVIMLVSVVTAFAHGGRTDGKGGHYDRSTGEYHYHHGYSAHQHPNGVCPYEETTRKSYEQTHKDDIKNEKETSRTGTTLSPEKDDVEFSFLVKLSPNYIWRWVDFVHLITIIVACVIFIYAYRDESKFVLIVSVLTTIALTLGSLSIDFEGSKADTFNLIALLIIFLSLGLAFVGIAFEICDQIDKHRRR